MADSGRITNFYRQRISPMCHSHRIGKGAIKQNVQRYLDAQSEPVSTSQIMAAVPHDCEQQLRKVLYCGSMCGMRYFDEFADGPNANSFLCFQYLMHNPPDPFFRENANLSCQNLWIRSGCVYIHYGVSHITGQQPPLWMSKQAYWMRRSRILFNHS